METLNSFCAILIFVPTYEQSIQISKILVNEELSYSCNVIPYSESFKGWKNNISEKKESIIISISKKDNIQLINERIYQILNDSSISFVSLEISHITGDLSSLL